MRLMIAASGFSQASKRLERVMEVARRPLVPAMKAAVWITGQTIKVFDEGGRPEKWAPLSLMTLFVRSHRASKRTDSKQPMNDTGRLKGSFVPVVEEGGSLFGAATNVEYAELMQDGGLSEASEVLIGPFTRKRPKSLGLVGGRGKYRSRKGGLVQVAQYMMKFKGGVPVPARPFFPKGMADLDAWGYRAGIRRIFDEYFRGLGIGGTA